MQRIQSKEKKHSLSFSMRAFVLQAITMKPLMKPIGNIKTNLVSYSE